MATIQFYHLTASPLERALPKLVEKAYGAGFRVHLLFSAPERVDYYNQLLWTYHPDSFLPHGSGQDAAPERQPVFLSAALPAPNQPDLLLVTDGTEPPSAEAYKRILDIFDGKNDTVVEKARERWKHYKDAGHEVAYFRQSEAGGWEKAA